MHEHTGDVQFQACVGAILLEALVLHEGDAIADAALGFEDRSFRPLHVSPVREAGLVGEHFAGGGFVAAEIERQRAIVVLVFDDAAYLVVRLAVLVFHRREVLLADQQLFEEPRALGNFPRDRRRHGGDDHM